MTEINLLYLQSAGCGHWPHLPNTFTATPRLVFGGRMVLQPCWHLTLAITVHPLQEGILIALQEQINESGNEWMCPVCIKHRADLGEWEEMKLESLGLNIEVLDSGFGLLNWKDKTVLCSTVQENFLRCWKCSDSVLLSSTIVTWPSVAVERHLKCD